MKEKKNYLSPRCVLTRVVLEEGLCATSGDNIQADVNGTLNVDDYASIGDSSNDYFNDISFN